MTEIIMPGSVPPTWCIGIPIRVAIILLMSPNGEASTARRSASTTASTQKPGIRARNDFATAGGTPSGMRITRLRLATKR